MSVWKGRLGLIVPWTLFALVCVGWTVFWFKAKDMAIARLDAAIVQAQARGIEAGYAQVRASGYPLHLTLTLENAHAQMAPLPRFDFVSLPVSVNLVDPSHLIIDLKDGVRWTGRDGVAHVIDPVRGAMSVHWKNNELTRVSLDLEGAPTKKTLIHIRPDKRTPDALQVAIDIEGNEATSALRAGVVVDHAAVLAQARGGDPLKPWIDAGGRARVELLEIRTQGATMTGDGEFQLDGLRRPEGAANLKVAGDSAAALAFIGALTAENTATLSAKDGQWRLGQLAYPAKPLYALSSSP